MKSVAVLAVIVGAGLLGACSGHSKEVPIYPVVAGEKTELYEAVSSSELKLAPGVRLKEAPGPGGKNNGFLLLRANGEVGGYIACGCPSSMEGSCITVSDNPEHASCKGGCHDSENNPRPCEMFGMIGPPKDPLRLRFRAR